MIKILDLNKIKLDRRCKIKFKMIEKYNDGSVGKTEHISKSEIKDKVEDSIETGCVKTIDVYITYGKKILRKVFHFKRIGTLTPWKLRRN